MSRHSSYLRTSIARFLSIYRSRTARSRSIALVSMLRIFGGRLEGVRKAFMSSRRRSSRSVLLVVDKVDK
jgi:VanZ family protein